MFTILQNENPSLRHRRNRLILTVVLMLPFAILTSNASAKKKFQVEEATIPGIHRAITTKQITCAGLVQAYIKRAAAYNGVCTKLVTADGTPIPTATGTVRAGAPLKFPTDTVAASNILPNLNQYVGLPIEFGRMEATASDPSVQQRLA
jgi:amidase